MHLYGTSAFESIAVVAVCGRSVEGNLKKSPFDWKRGQTTSAILLIVFQSDFALGGSRTIGGIVTYGCVEESSKSAVCIRDPSLLNRCRQVMRLRLPTFAACECIEAAQRSRVDIVRA